MFKKDPGSRMFGVTAVENCFIHDFLPIAKGDFVKVYLWGLYACQYADDTYTLEEMARDLDMDVPEIEAALRYWERRALVSRVSDHPVRYCFYSPLQRKMDPATPQVDAEYVSFAESVYAAFGERRKVNPGEIAFAWEWVQDIGLKPEVVLMLLHHCIAERGVNFSFKKAEPLAVRMKDHQVVSCEDADAFLRHRQAAYEGTRKVLAHMGKRRFASEDELDLYEKWTDAWHFTLQAILDACAEMTKGDPSFKYLDSILGGIHARSDARTAPQVKKQLAQEEVEKSAAQEVCLRLGVRLPAPAAVRLYREFLAIQPHEVLLLAADECRRTHKNVEDMQALLLSWQSRGLKNENDVKEYLAKYRESNLALREIFEACGHRGSPTAADRALYEKWRGWDMNRDLLLLAGEKARAAEGSKIGYMDKVLEMWHEAGITDISQAQAQKKPARGQAPGKTVTAQQYGQRTYTEEELSAVSGDLIEEAKKQRG